MESQKAYFRNEVSKMNDRMKELKKLYFEQMRNGGGVKSKTSGYLPPLLNVTHHELNNPLNIHPIEEYKEGIERHRESVGDRHQTESKHDGITVATLKDVFKRYSLEQEELQENIEKRKSNLMLERRKSSHYPMERNMSVFELLGKQNEDDEVE